MWLPKSLSEDWLAFSLVRFSSLHSSLHEYFHTWSASLLVSGCQRWRVGVREGRYPKERGCPWALSGLLLLFFPVGNGDHAPGPAELHDSNSCPGKVEISAQAAEDSTENKGREKGRARRGWSAQAQIWSATTFHSSPSLIRTVVNGARGQQVQALSLLVGTATTVGQGAQRL